MSPEKKKHFKNQSEEGSPFEQDNGISPGKQDPLKLTLEDAEDVHSNWDDNAKCNTSESEK